MSLDAHEGLLNIQFFERNQIDKYKSSFTFDRLLRKSAKLRILASNVEEAALVIKSTVEQKNFELVVNHQRSFCVFAFFLKHLNSTFPFEIFLYKNDSKQYNTKIEELKQIIDSLKLENSNLVEIGEKQVLELECLCEENLKLKADYEDLQSSLADRVSESLESLRDEQMSLIEDAEIKMKLIKKDLILASTNSKVDRFKISSHIPILYDTERELLSKWFNSQFDLVLAYDSVVDGSTASDFHEKCDGKIQTLTFIETKHGLRFGGYTKLIWNASEENPVFKDKDDTAFIFSLDKKRKFLCSDQTSVIACSTKYGPTFGRGDISISDNFTKIESSSSVQTSYGEKDELEKFFCRQNYLAGIEFFLVSRIEVYQVIFK